MDENDGIVLHKSHISGEVQGTGDRKGISEDPQKGSDETMLVENSRNSGPMEVISGADSVANRNKDSEQNSYVDCDEVPSAINNISPSPENYSESDPNSRIPEGSDNVVNEVELGVGKEEATGKEKEQLLSDRDLNRTCDGSDVEGEDVDSNCDLNDLEDFSQSLLDDGDDVKSGERDLTGDGNDTAGDRDDVKGDGKDKSQGDDGVKEGDAFNEDTGGESTDTEGDYESADDGEDIEVEEENMRDVEETLTAEDKEERRQQSVEIKQDGNRLFVAGSYKSGIKTYNRALNLCPLKFPLDRAMMYSNRAACKVKLENISGAIKDCSKAIELNPDYVKALIRRAELYEKDEKPDEALADYQKILELDPSIHMARAACMRLPDQIKERNEKLKNEMIGKLKDLGNLVLRPFGLSTDNFQMQQNPDTGGYSVNFSQNPGGGNNGK